MLIFFVKLNTMLGRFEKPKKQPHTFIAHIKALQIENFQAD
jgi:hypothetical protein